MKGTDKSGQEPVYQRNADLIGASVDDELVMMSVEHGQYYGLGGVGPRVWELLDQPRTLNELVEVILDEYEVERAVCESDLVGFLAQMEKLGLIERG